MKNHCDSISLIEKSLRNAREMHYVQDFSYEAKIRKWCPSKKKNKFKRSTLVSMLIHTFLLKVAAFAMYRADGHLPEQVFFFEVC